MISVQLADTAIRSLIYPLDVLHSVAMWGYPALSLTHLVTSDIFWVTGPASDFNIRKKSRDLRMSSSQEHEASIMIMFPVIHDIVTATTLQNWCKTHCKVENNFISSCFLEVVEIFSVSSVESALRRSHWELAKTLLTISHLTQISSFLEISRLKQCFSYNKLIRWLNCIKTKSLRTNWFIAVRYKGC